MAVLYFLLYAHICFHLRSLSVCPSAHHTLHLPTTPSRYPPRFPFSIFYSSCSSFLSIPYFLSSVYFILFFFFHLFYSYIYLFFFPPLTIFFYHFYLSLYHSFSPLSLVYYYYSIKSFLSMLTIFPITHLFYFPFFVNFFLSVLSLPPPSSLSRSLKRPHRFSQKTNKHTKKTPTTTKRYLTRFSQSGVD